MPKKATTTVVLKAPKTESSNRTVYLPRAVVEELLAMQEMDSGFFNKVEDVADTSPLDDASIEKLKALIKQHPELLNELLNTN